MDAFMGFLYGRLQPLIEARWFELLVSLIIFANPVAIFPQVLYAFTAPSVEGVAVQMWYIFATIQAALMFHGVKSKSASMFFSMLISLIESVTIIVTITLRS